MQLMWPVLEFAYCTIIYETLTCLCAFFLLLQIAASYGKKVCIFEPTPLLHHDTTHVSGFSGLPCMAIVYLMDIYIYKIIQIQKVFINPTWGNYVSAPLKHCYNETHMRTIHTVIILDPYIIIILI